MSLDFNQALIGQKLTKLDSVDGVCIMAINRMDAEGYGDLFITKISQKILDALPAAGWNVVIEDDYPGLKDYACSRNNGIAEAFTRMNVVVVTQELEDCDAEGVCLHFIFYADPAKIGEDKRAFGRYFRKDSCSILWKACEEIMMRAWVPIALPPSMHSVRVEPRHKNTKVNFGNGYAVQPAYRVEISYWVGKVMMERYGDVVPYRFKLRNEESSLQMYEGIPEFFDFIIGLVERKPIHDSRSIVAYHLLADILDAAQFALIHTFTLTLDEEFLQNSSRGTPYQKWAKILNEKFLRIDKCLKALIPVIECIYGEISNDDYTYNGGSTRSEWVWLEKFNKKYTCCVINIDEPSLTLSAINFDGWLDLSYKRFGDVYLFKTAPVVIKTEMPIADRSVLMELKNVGKACIDKMSASLARLAVWLEANYTMAEVTSPRRKIDWK